MSSPGPDPRPPLDLLSGPAAQTPVDRLAGVGARRAEALHEAGLHTLCDLLVHLPRRYLDRSRILPIAQAPVGEEVTLIASVRAVRPAPPRRAGRGGPPHTVEVADDSGSLVCVWFQGGRHHAFETGDVVALSGRIEVFRGQRQVSHPEYEFVSEGGGEGELLHTGGVIPLYGSTAGMKERGLRSRGFRRLIRAALDRCAGDLTTQLPDGAEDRHGLLPLGQALAAAHFPHDLGQAEQARRRLAFEELFLLMRELRTRRLQVARQPGTAFPESQRLVPRLLACLPFALTEAQRRALAQIDTDMGASVPMRRLLHGDVGSGKTVVALCAALRAMEHGCQVAFMAPTEILAEQHVRNLAGLTRGLGIDGPVLVKGGMRAAARRELLTGLATGGIRLAVGTHALLEDDVAFARLGLAVIDEQHRFGVAQRARLSAKGEGIDVLVMTATPIPRSLALTLYGDLDVSVLDEQPPGRRPVRTALRDGSARERIYAFLAERVREGRQGYVVFPLIDGSEAADLTSACAGFEELAAGALAGLRLALLHGRMDAGDKGEVMARFASGAIDVLVTTTVVEVGVDVANATVMVVEHAERFGLAQLHQLRGRVGRGGDDAYCILVAAPGDAEAGRQGAGDGAARERLEALCATTDGFVLARRDLELRGPGELLGTRQAGMPELRVAHLLRDEDLLEPARAEASRAVGAGPSAL